MINHWRSRFAIGFVLVVIAAVATLFVGGLSFGGNHLNSITLAKCHPAHSTAPRVHVSLYDGGEMMGQSPTMLGLTESPSSVSAGMVTFVATNYGLLNHELLVLPMSAGGPGFRPLNARGTIDESTSLGEASRSCSAGSGGGITSGTRSWVTLDLRPGKYELLCDVPWHYANGMYASFSVR